MLEQLSSPILPGPATTSPVPAPSPINCPTPNAGPRDDKRLTEPTIELKLLIYMEQTGIARSMLSVSSGIPIT